MISRKTKALFYTLANPMMRLSSVLYRTFKAPQSGLVRAQLGPGQKNYLEDWINIDANVFTGKCDVWADIRYKLPLKSNSVTAMYSHHVIEHLPSLKSHFKEVYRCLAKGGVYRVGGPNGHSAIKKYIEGDSEWFSDFPDNRDSIGGRFENLIFCRNEHLTILTPSFLEEITSDIGFRFIGVCLPTKQTFYPELFSDCLKLEYEKDFDTPRTLLIEIVKE